MSIKLRCGPKFDGLVETGESGRLYGEPIAEMTREELVAVVVMTGKGISIDDPETLSDIKEQAGTAS